MVAVRDGAAADLAHAYVKAWQRVEEELARLHDPATWRRQSRLTEIQGEIAGLMGDLDRTTRTWIEDRLPGVWASGAEQFRSGPIDWTLAHREALARVADDTHGYLLAATTHVEDSAKSTIRTIVRDATFQKLIEGQTAVQAGKSIAARLKAEGVEAIVYKNGARVGLGTYGEMVARTQTALAYNYGELTEAVEQRIKYVEVFDGQGCGWGSHSDSDTANGSIRTVEDAAAFPIAHPRCLRSFVPRPDLGLARSKKDLTQRVADSVASSTGVPAQTSGEPFVSAIGGNPRLQTRQKRLEGRAERVGPKVPPTPAEAAPAHLRAVSEARTSIGLDENTSWRDARKSIIDEHNAAGLDPNNREAPSARAARLDARFAEIEQRTTTAGKAVDDEIQSRLEARGVKAPSQTELPKTAELVARRDRAMADEIHVRLVAEGWTGIDPSIVERALHGVGSSRLQDAVLRHHVEVSDLPHIRELSQAARDVLKEVAAARVAIAAAEKAYREAVGEATIEVLSEIRAMGSIKANPWGMRNRGSKMVGSVDRAAKYYPSEWIESSQGVSVKQVRRGYYSHSDGLVATDGTESTALHELGHRMERTRGLLDLEHAFYERRTAGEATQSLKRLAPRSSYRRDEIARPDEFRNPYMGKDYSHGGSGPAPAYEIVSMGMESVMLGRYEAWMDDDLRHFILGLLSTL